jgi:hypothetical protein
MDESQRGMVGANIANLSRGGDRTSEQSANLRFAQTSIAEAAQAVNVGVRTITSAKKVRADGDVETRRHVEAWKRKSRSFKRGNGTKANPSFEGFTKFSLNQSQPSYPPVFNT